MHDHAHSPHADGSRVDKQSQKRRLEFMLALTGLFMLVEVAGGYFSGSLALMADAVHMFADSFSILLTYLALWLSTRAVSANRTYGFRRAELLAAFINALALLLLALWIVVEAIERMGEPRPVQAGILLAVAGVGLLVNVIGIFVLLRPARENMAVRATLWHVTGDLLGSLGALIAGAIILVTGWLAIDALISIGIAILVAASGVRIMFDSANLLLDSVPREIDSGAVSRFLISDPNVRDICDLHIWGVSSNESMLTAHLVVEKELDRDNYLAQVTRALKAKFNLAHMTLQLETSPQETCHDEW